MRFTSFLIFLLCSTTAAADYDEEIAALANRQDVARALEVIDDVDEQAVHWLIELNEIPAPPFKEELRAGYYADLLRNVGVEDVSIDEVGNVLARIHGRTGKRTIAVVAHLDTVFPEGTNVVVERKGGQYCAPGIGDNGRGLVAMLMLAQSLVESGVELDADVLLVGSVGEEGIGDLRGVRHLFRPGGPSIDEFIAIDGGGATRMTIVAVGSIRYRLEFKGPGGHSFGAFGRANPAHALARTIYHFDEAASKYVLTPGPKVTYNIGRIGGGTSVNSIPFENWAEVDMRSANPDRLKAIDDIFAAAVSQGLLEQNEKRALEAPLTVNLVRIGNRPAGETPADSPLVQRMQAAIRLNGGEAKLREGSTDSNIPISMGVPAVTVGGGGASSNAHSLHECWRNTVDADDAVKNVLLTVIASDVD